MPSIQVASFSAVIIALEQSAEQIRSQKKVAAQNTIRSISEQIKILAEISRERESEYKNAQQKITGDISEIIQRESILREQSLSTQESIDTLNMEIQKGEVNKDALINAIHSLEIRLRKTESDLRMHQAKLREINDESVVSIFRSIFLLALDPVIMGVAALIDDDAGCIKSLNDELSVYRNALNQDIQD